MSLFCKLFGHSPEPGYGGVYDEVYFRVKNIVEDGIGRKHASLYCKCERCSEVFKVGNVHLPKANDERN